MDAAFSSYALLVMKEFICGLSPQNPLELSSETSAQRKKVKKKRERNETVFKNNFEVYSDFSC